MDPLIEGILLGFGLTMGATGMVLGAYVVYPDLLRLAVWLKRRAIRRRRAAQQQGQSEHAEGATLTS